MTDTITRHELAETAAKLKDGTLSPDDYLTQLNERFTRIEPQVQAFVPEANRFDRLRDELNTVNNKTLPLYGIPVGIKDIFHVDGLVTRAGNRPAAGTIRRRTGSHCQ